jgi:hypothetical protein
VHPTLKGAAGQRSSQNTGKLCLKSELSLCQHIAS